MTVDGVEYSYICHVIDHYSSFNLIWAQSKKDAKEVVTNLRHRVLAIFGLPKILTAIITSSSVTIIVTNKDNDTDQDEDEEFDDEDEFNKNETARATQRTLLTEVLHTRKRQNREKMVKMHNGKRNKNTADFKVGDIISVLIPSVDRGLCDNKRIPRVVKEAKQKNNHMLYILQSKFGILDQGYHSKEMEKYLGVMELPPLESFPLNKSTGLHEYPKLSLR